MESCSSGALPDIEEIADAASELDRLFDMLGLVDPGEDAVLADDPDAMTLERLPRNSCRYPTGSTAFGRTVFCGEPTRSPARVDRCNDWLAEYLEREQYELWVGVHAGNVDFFRQNYGSHFLLNIVRYLPANLRSSFQRLPPLERHFSIDPKPHQRCNV